VGGDALSIDIGKDKFKNRGSQLGEFREESSFVEDFIRKNVVGGYGQSLRIVVRISKEGEICKFFNWADRWVGEVEPRKRAAERIK